MLHGLVGEGKEWKERGSLKGTFGREFPCCARDEVVGIVGPGELGMFFSSWLPCYGSLDICRWRRYRCHLPMLHYIVLCIAVLLTRSRKQGSNYMSRPRDVRPSTRSQTHPGNGSRNTTRSHPFARRTSPQLSDNNNLPPHKYHQKPYLNRRVRAHAARCSSHQCCARRDRR